MAEGSAVAVTVACLGLPAAATLASAEPFLRYLVIPSAIVVVAILAALARSGRPLWLYTATVSTACLWGAFNSSPPVAASIMLVMAAVGLTVGSLIRGSLPAALAFSSVAICVQSFAKSPEIGTRLAGPHGVTMTASVLAILLPAQWSQRRELSALFGPVVTWTLLATYLATLALSGSRGPAIAAVVGIFLVSAKVRDQRWAAWLACAVLALSVALFRFAGEAPRLLSEGSNAGRKLLMEAALRRAEHAWPWGEGWNPAVFGVNNPVSGHLSQSADPHSLPLMAVLQFGAPGLLLVVALTAALLLAAKDLPPPRRALVHAIWASLAVLSLFETTSLMPTRFPLTFLWFASIGFALSERKGAAA